MPHETALPQELSIYTVAELRGTWLAALVAGTEGKPDGALRVDASGVEQIDAAGVQWLLALRASAQAQQRALILERPSDVLRGACDALGLTDLTEAATTEQGTA